MPDASFFQGRLPNLPYTLKIKEIGDVELTQWLRVLPDKRYVAKALWQSKEIVLKVFVGDKADKYFQQELAGVRVFEQLELAYAKCEFNAELTPQYCCIAYQFLAGQSLAQLWNAHNEDDAISDQQKQLLQSVLMVVADMHLNGAIQQDLHLDNFFYYDKRIYLLDAGGIKLFNLHQPVSSKVALQNLATLFAQLSRRVTPYLADFLAGYYKKTGFNTIKLPELQHSIDAMRRWRTDDVLKKTARDCSLFYFQKTAKGVEAAVRSELDNVRAILNSPDEFITNGHVYKTGGSATVARVEHQGRCYVVKRNNVKNRVHFLKRCWRKSRAWHSWQAAHLLTMSEVPVVKVLAVKETRIFGLRHVAWLITEYSGEQHLHQRFAPYVDNGNVPENELQSLKNLFNSMIREKISHGDCKAFNIFWHNARFELIDLDAVQRHKTDAAFRKAFNKDRERLLRNWPVDSALYQRLDQELPK